MRSKNRKQRKYANNETEHEDPLVTENLVVKETSYFNLFECGKNILNRLDTTCKRLCMEGSRDKYYMEILKTITDYNDCNDA